MSKGKVVFCTPSLNGPTIPYVESMEASIPLLVEAGWDEGYTQELGNPYISAARMGMTRKALDSKADVIVYLDYDLSWSPGDLLKLIETEGDVVCGTYRFKKDEEEYMGRWITEDDGTPIVREDGCVKTYLAPAGFLKVTKRALTMFMKKYPELVCGDPLSPQVDLFNHGARDGIWWGEDFGFCDRWIKAGGEIWTVPDLNINHHSSDFYTRKSTKEFKGNLHKWLMRLEGGSLHQPDLEEQLQNQSTKETEGEEE